MFFYTLDGAMSERFLQIRIKKNQSGKKARRRKECKYLRSVIRGKIAQRKGKTRLSLWSKVKIQSYSLFFEMSVLSFSSYPPTPSIVCQ